MNTHLSLAEREYWLRKELELEESKLGHVKNAAKLYATRAEEQQAIVSAMRIALNRLRAKQRREAAT